MFAQLDSLLEDLTKNIPDNDFESIYQLHQNHKMIKSLREGIAERQKKGLGRLEDEEKKGAGSDGKREADGLDDDDDDDNALFQDDAWAGTSLYDLMMSPRKERSLVDPRGIKSSTKAAAGYTQTSQRSGPDVGSRDGSAAAVEPPSSPLGHRAQEQHTVVDETASDDDLDIQPKTMFKRTAQNVKVPKSKNLEGGIKQATEAVQAFSGGNWTSGSAW